MNKLFFLLALTFSSVTFGGSAADQATVAVPVPPLNHDAERSRIQSERTFAEAAYQREEAACYQHFAVTDCIRQLRRERRLVLDKLRQQENVLNASDRKRKALDQIEKIKEKSSEKRLEEEAARRLEARSDQQAREDNSAQKIKALSAQKPTPTDVVPAKKATDQGLSAGEIAKNQQQYKDKLKDAAAHRATRLKSNSEKTGEPKKPLPDQP
jgi:colicin import membrane protein